VTDAVVVSPDTIPAALQARPWVLWAAEPDPDGGKPNKVPRMIAAPTRRASSTDPSTWGTFGDAYEAYSALTEDRRWAPLHIAGIGVVLVGDGLVCVDLDGAITPTGGLTRAAATIVRRVPTFTERSWSGLGLHLWVSGTLHRAMVSADIEAYDRGRFIAVTGQRYPGTPPSVEPAPDLLMVLEELSRPQAPPPVTSPRPDPARVRRLTPMPEGARDNTLFRIAAKLVREGTLGPALVAALLDANVRLCQPPLPERDVRRIARSASRDASASPA
jgi:primase-like protein